MKFSTINTIQKSRDIYRGFGGLNNTHAASENQFEDMVNMSMDDYPYIRTRRKRGCFDFEGKTIFGADKLIWSKEGTSGSRPQVDLYYDVYRVLPNMEEGKKQFAAIGKTIAMMPEKLLITNGGVKSMVWEITPSYFRMGICNKNGSVPTGWDTASVSESAPSSPEDGDMWINTSNAILSQYNADDQNWYAVEAYTYIQYKRQSSDILNPSPQDNLKPGDKITISGANNAGSDYIKANGDYTVVNVTSRRIVVSGVIAFPVTTPITNNTAITITRPIPEMDYICASGNRLWGCNSLKNEIYCSALGDPARFYTFAGVSTDSYAATLGTPGEFTGCAAYRGEVLFFKENYIHKVTGSYPAQFQITEIHCRGVQKGCWASIALLNETLFYKSKNAVMAYTGGLPYSVSGALEGEKLSEAVAGAIDNKLYMCMKDESNEYWMYVYDAEHNTWSKEDNICVTSMGYAADLGDLYFKTSDNKTFNVNNTPRIFIYDTAGGGPSGTVADQRYSEEEEVEFSLTTAKLFMDSINRTWVNGLKMRVRLEPGAKINIEIQYDGGAWNNVHNSDKFGEYVISIPLLQRSCDYCRVRISGQGDFTLMGLSKTYSEGADV